MAGVLVFLATRNEAGNVTSLLPAIRERAPDADVLVVDDESNDGTVDAIRSLGLPRVTVIQRRAGLGLGTAHVFALLHAMHHDYDAIVTMDADLSHDPTDIPALLAALDAGADLCVGSRYMAGGVCDYVGWRRFLSVAGNAAYRRVLGLPLHEFTTSLRAFRVSRLRSLDVGRLISNGYSFFTTTIAEAAMHGFAIAEVPIHFHKRGYGVSKIPPFEIFRAMRNLVRLRRRMRDAAAVLGDAKSGMRCAACDVPYSFVGDGTGSGLCVSCGARGS